MKLRGISIYKPKRRRKAHHPYLIAIRLPGKSAQVVTGSTDREDTRELAERLSRLCQRIELGLSDAAELRQEIQRRLALTQHLNDYEKHLKATGKTGKHALQMRLYAEEAVESYLFVDRIVASEVQAAVWKLKVSATTKNRRLYAVGDFLAWGGSDNRWPKKLVESMSFARLPQTKIRQRRVLQVDDLVRLIDVAENGVAVAGCSGKQRALMYRTLVASGLRFGELTRLRVCDIRDNGFQCPAHTTKNRKEAWITLPKTLLAEIVAFIDGRRSDSLIFPVTKFNPDRLLKHDLDQAGIPRKTDRGVFDFHSLRHQCATILAASGAQPKAIQAHMRHGSVKLTLDTYGHLFDRDRVRAAEVMGEIVQRRAQRTEVQMHVKNAIPQWSHGESNPDLLNAIQNADALIELHRNELKSKRGKRIAPGAAQRLLRRFFVRADRRAAGRGRR
jgi:integrase